MTNSEIRANLYELEEKLIAISHDFDNPIEMCDKSIEEVVVYVKQLKELVLEHSFKDQEEEIQFFKTIKPKFTSKLIFYKKVKKMEVGTPQGTIEAITEYYKNELQKLNFFFSENAVLYNYYRLDSTYLDSQLFVRNNYNVCPNVNPAYYEMDHRFATSHDSDLAKILAHSMFQSYVENKLLNLNDVKPFELEKMFEDEALMWTGKKSDLVEIIYAFYYAKVINNGKADIAQIARAFEKMFNLRLGKFYRTKSHIKERKGIAKFLDKLKKTLVENFEM